MNSYRTIGEPGQAEIMIQKSRFITAVYAVTSEEECQTYLNQIKKKYYDATHHCSAYILGIDQEYQKSNDDGEPSGTAGRPILEILKKQALTDTLVIVTRYFGGTKLGANGLIRAYGKSALAGLAASSIVEKRLFYRYHLQFTYDLQGMIENKLRQNHYVIEDRQFSSDVTFHILIEESQKTAFYELVRESSAGQAKVSEAGQTYGTLPSSLL